jgi:phosphate transport system permease protein
MAHDPSPEPIAVSHSVRKQLLAPGKFRLFGKNRDWWIKQFFEGNAALSIVVLVLIVFTLFREAAGFMPGNRRNLEVYRRAGLEYVDILKAQTDQFAALGRELSATRLAWFGTLKEDGLDSAAANARLAAIDALDERLAEAISPLRDIVSEMTDHASGVKERVKVAEDMAEVRGNLLDGMAAATPEAAASLKTQAAAVEIEQVDFTTEVAALTARLPEIQAANHALSAELGAILAALPSSDDPAIRKRLVHFGRSLEEFRAEIPKREGELVRWRADRPVGFFESFNAFLFGRTWITASFWQDWYGVLPLFFGSVFISLIALAIAIPLGVCAALYVNQVAPVWEQRFIKPYIEFISAIPSVVLGFFGIAMLGETVRLLSQVPWLSWVPGFPMQERLNAFTAAALLALMAIPTIFTLAEDALQNVPKALREASLALGATRMQTIVRIILPAALSGITAAILLGFGRVIGETMVVLLCAGNRIAIPDFAAGLGVAFQPVHTMTGIVAQEMGEVVRGSLHYRALFMVGSLLFMLSLGINYGAQKIVLRYRLPQS